MRFRELLELQITKLSGSPPTITKPREGPDRRPEGGDYWFHISGRKLAVPGGRTGANDFAIYPLLQWQQFGFDPRQELTWLEQHSNKVAANSFRRFLNITQPQLHIEAPDDNYQQHLRKDGINTAFWASGARDGGIAYAMANRWSYIEYDEDHATIWMLQKDAKDIVASMGTLFPLSYVPVIKLVMPDRSSSFVNSTLEFHREDSSGFGGAFSALMQWANHGTVPEQNWLYTIVPPGNESRVDDAGIHPTPNQYVRTGNWTDRDVFTLPFYHRRAASMWLRNRPGSIYRFPASIVPRLGLKNGGDRERFLFSKEPFVIPADTIQRKTIAGWASFAT